MSHPDDGEFDARHKCGCGRTFASLRREYDHIEETIGRTAAEGFDYIHEGHNMEDADDDDGLPGTVEGSDQAGAGGTRGL